VNREPAAWEANQKTKAASDADSGWLSRVVRWAYLDCELV